MKDDTTVSRSDSTIDRRVWVAATNDFTPWFVGEILGYIVRISNSEAQGKFTDKDEDTWFMDMSDLGDVFSKDET
jgi:hypothetical protein